MEDMTIRAASVASQWENPEITPLRPFAYTPSRGRAKKGSLTLLRNMTDSAARRRINANYVEQAIGGTLGGRIKNHSRSSQNHTQESENRPVSWGRLFGKSAPHTPSNLTDAGTTTSPQVADNEQVEDNQPSYEIEYKKVGHYPRGSIVQLAAFLDSDDSLCMIRRFGTETLRLIEFKQIELDQLSREIDAIDEKDSKSEETGHRLQSIEHYDAVGWDKELVDKLKSFDKKINEYYDLVLKFVAVRSLEPPTDVQYNNVFKWMKTNTPIIADEHKTMLRKDDFVTTRKSRQNNRKIGIEDSVEAWLAKEPTRCLNSWLQGKKEKDKTDNDNPQVQYISTRRFAQFVQLILTIFVIGTMLVPICIIFLVQPSREIVIAIVAIFVTLVMVLMSLVIDVTAQDVILVMAAYSAVLVALLSNMIHQGDDCDCKT